MIPVGVTDETRGVCNRPNVTLGRRLWWHITVCPFYFEHGAEFDGDRDRGSMAVARNRRGRLRRVFASLTGARVFFRSSFHPREKRGNQYPRCPGQSERARSWELRDARMERPDLRRSSPHIHP